MDRIRVAGLVVPTHVGVSAAERSQAQEVRIDVSLGLDLRAAGARDSLDDTVDYGALTERVAALVAGMEAQLLERIAEEIAGLVLGFKQVREVAVEVAKLHPPIAETVDAIAVKIERSRR